MGETANDSVEDSINEANEVVEESEADRPVE